MQSKTIIAFAVASAFAMPLALAQSDPATNTTGGSMQSGAGTSVRGGGSAAPSGETEHVPTKTSARDFQRMDRNKDGYLSKEETKGALYSQFDQLDKDHDGKLSQAEVSGNTASSSRTTTGSRGSDRISRNDRGSSAGPDEAPNMPRDPQRPANPPKSGTE